jgi:protein phosphatase-4 regulatory subunit 3
VQEGIKSLIVHLVETYSSKLESVDYVDTFQALKLKYDQVDIFLNLVFE